jgi:hypothetical protein
MLSLVREMACGCDAWREVSLVDNSWPASLTRGIPWRASENANFINELAECKCDGQREWLHYLVVARHLRIKQTFFWSVVIVSPARRACMCYRRSSHLIVKNQSYWTNYIAHRSISGKVFCCHPSLVSSCLAYRYRVVVAVALMNLHCISALGSVFAENHCIWE